MLSHVGGTLGYVEVMMETENISLSLPADVLAKAELIAAQRHASVSELLTQFLEKLVEHEDACATCNG
jgi:hypothetical protein